MTDCSELMQKLSAIEAKLDSLGDKYIPKSERGSIVEEGGNKGKALAVAAILPMLGAYTLQSDFLAAKANLQGGIDRAASTASNAMGLGQKAFTKAETALQAQERLRAEIARFQAAIAALDAEIDVVNGKATNALGTARSASELADLANGKAGTAMGKADNALSEARGVRRLYDDLNGRFVAFQNRISSAIDSAIRKADDALSKAARAIGVSDEALAVGKRAFSVAMDALGKIAIVFQIIDTVFQFLATLDLRNRVQALERRMSIVEGEVSKILGLLFSIKEQIGSLAARFPQIESIAKQALSIANAAASTAQAAQSIADRALAMSLANATAIVAQTGLINGIANKADRALTQRGQPGPRGERGLQGLPGIAGRSGRDGRDGRDGKPGKNGKDGRNGVDGKTVRLTPVTIVQRIIQPMQPIIRNNTIKTNTTIVQKMDDALLRKIDATTSSTNGIAKSLLALNTGMNAVLNGVFRIVEKSGKLVAKTWDFLQVDRVLSVLTYVTTLHNAYFLSRSIGETLFFMVDNVLSLIGIEDSEGNPINTGEIVKTWLKDAVTTLVGEENLEGIKAEWAKHSRIYQAAMNTLYILGSMGDSSRMIVETIGNYVAKIGNALKRSGEVMESSYGWMSEKLNATSVGQTRWENAFTRLETVDNVTNDMAAVASEVVSLKQYQEELKTHRGELNTLITGEEQGKTDIEDEAKADSEAPISLEAVDPYTVGVE